MSKFCCTAALFLFSVISLPAQGLWTWMSGDSTGSPPAVYGTQGVAAPANVPTGLSEAASFTDLQENFWVFGGQDGNYQNRAALWKYDPVTQLWTWMKGPTVTAAAGVYGTQGIPSPANFPGARSRGMYWTDLQGNFWIFGGSGHDANGTAGLLADLWKYDPATNEWTWVSGPSTVNYPGSYGNFRQPAPSNHPPARYASSATWTDANGDLWLYGGYDSTSELLGDLWRYSIATNLWTWMSGANVTNAPADYGTRNIPSPSNTPGGMLAGSHWVDLAGNFWMYGGSNSDGELATMWKYDPAAGEWTWMAGSNYPNAYFYNGPTCAPGARPSARYINTTCWTDACGRFWFYGGILSSGVLPDLWMFDPVSLEFTWANGTVSSTQFGSFGTQYVASPTNRPPGSAGNAAFTDPQGNLWMFGGVAFFYGKTNALWKYTPSPTCPSSTGSVAATLFHDSVSCTQQHIRFNAGTGWPGFSYQWDFGDTSTAADTSSLFNPVYTYTDTGTYTVTLIVSSAQGCFTGSDTATTTITITAITSPIDIGNDTTICGLLNLQLDAGNAASWQWSTGDTTQAISVAFAGTYAVQAVNAQGCPASDTLVIAQAMPSLGPDSTDCDPLFLDAGDCPGCSFAWSTGDTTQYIFAAATGTYYVTVTSPGGACSASDTISFTLATPPSVTLSLPVQQVCETDPAFLLTGGFPAGGTYLAPGYVTGNLFDPGNGPGSVIVYYMYTNAAGCADFEVDTIVVDACTGVGENNPSPALQIFPVPASGELTVLYSSEGNAEVQLSLFNAAGQLVYRDVKTGSGVIREKISLAGMPEGIYLLRVVDGEKEFSGKVVTVKE